MIVVCPDCAFQIQANGPDTSTRSDSLRCPKCNTSVTSGTVSPASEKSALAVGNSPSTEQSRFKARVPAPLFELGRDKVAEKASPSLPLDEMNRLLANLLSHKGSSGTVAPDSRPSWNLRKALVCTSEQHRETIGRQLAQNGYQVFVAHDTGQAVDRMRENHLDVVLLDPEFDSGDQGAAFVIREVNVLRPSQRRRVFFVLLSPAQRTMEAHAAFLHNVNGIVNFRDIGDLAGILEHALREYNELYKEFNVALNVAAI